MAKDMQAKIMERLEGMTFNAGPNGAQKLDFVDQRAFANSGTVYALDPDFRTVAAFSYDFQDRYCRFQFGRTESARNADRGVSGNMADYDDHAKLSAVFARWSKELVDGLAEARKERAHG